MGQAQGHLPPALLLGFRVASLGATSAPPVRRRSESPPRMQFKVLQPRGTVTDARNVAAIQLRLASLNMNNRTHCSYTPTDGSYT